ncbi:phosphatidylinositol 3-kinase regulatory subunit alpha-like [Homarus americanus]|uniref:phosphatidylinositol 3-kinase regulatory subunit alpha-like n=1 Tax=Homarus americanus TaxID=6706 RepID=UPI001C48D6C4|nr:phosphatidylinositol 3-kinase regulatory subunit alpha-like [Homarus americanus]
MQATSETVYIYVARQSYRGSGNNDPSMEVDDIIHVSSEFLHRQNINKDKPDGWLYGVNMRTGQEGYFPGYFLLPNGTQIRTMTPRRRPPPLPDGKAPINDKQGYMHLGRASLPGDIPPPALYGGRRSVTGPLMPVQHQLGNVFFITPVLCLHCKYHQLCHRMLASSHAEDTWRITHLGNLAH